MQSRVLLYRGGWCVGGGGGFPVGRQVQHPPPRLSPIPTAVGASLFCLVAERRGYGRGTGMRGEERQTREINEKYVITPRKAAEVKRAARAGVAAPLRAPPGARFSLTHSAPWRRGTAG